MTSSRIALILAHRLAILAYIVVALFPLYWLLKVAVTPNDLLYSEGVRMWPSRTTFEHFRFVIAHSAFPTFFKNSLIVAGSTAFVVTVIASLSGYALSRFNFRAKYWIVALMLLTQMFPLVMLVAPIFKILSPLGLTNSLVGLVIVYSAFNVPFATFPVGLLSFVSKFSVNFGQMMAAGVLALIPACLFFLLIQRYLVQGLTAGAVKG